jgi:hypothetical protein
MAIFCVEATHQLLFKRAALHAQASPREQVHDDQYQHDHQEYVDESSPNVEQEPDQPKEEQNDDNRP